MATDAEDLNAPPEMKEEIDEKQGSILMGIIKQLRPGMDLSRVTLPTFILEPRSFLERMSDWMQHQDLLIAAGQLDDPVERFIAVIKWYIAGWHIRPKGVKKPYNPILGEEFHARFPDAKCGDTVMVAEQVTHHPPVSAVYFENRKAGFLLNGHIYTRSKFLGNSAACVMEGSMQLYFTNRDGEEITFSLPTAYVRGVIFGKLIMELGDKVKFECKATGLSAEVEFKTKGYFRGDYNEIKGTISKGKTALFTIDGKWDSVVNLMPAGTKDKQVLWDVSKGVFTYPLVKPTEEQRDNESRKVWQQVTEALRNRDQDTATKYKTEIEDAQRAKRAELAAAGKTHQQKYFKQDSEGRWRFINLNTKPYDPRDDADSIGAAAAAASSVDTE